MNRLECHDWDLCGYPGEFVYGDDAYVDDYYMDELWLPIYDFPGYWISDHGRVYGPGGKSRHGDFVKPVLMNGYYKVTLSCGKYRDDKRINRLVAQAFIPNPYNFPVVMHLDNDPTNNHVNNLAWGTHSDNNKYCWDCGRHPITFTDDIREKAYAARRTPIVAINIKSGKKLIFESQHDAARALNVTQQHIWGVLKNSRRSTGGYRFEYLEEECLDVH